MKDTKPSIVFCHGIWADGSYFSKVVPALQAEGHQCIAAQYATSSTPPTRRMRMRESTVFGAMIVTHGVGTLSAVNGIAGAYVWCSIGYATPALLGAILASPGRRHILLTGEGSLQMTVQELSTVMRHDL